MFFSISFAVLLVLFFFLCILMLGVSLYNKTILKIILILICLGGLTFSCYILRLLIILATL